MGASPTEIPRSMASATATRRRGGGLRPKIEDFLVELKADSVGCPVRLLALELAATSRRRGAIPPSTTAIPDVLP